MKKTGFTFILVLAIALISSAQTTRYFEFMTECGGGNWVDTSFVVATSNQSVIDTVLVELAKPIHQRKFITGKITAGNGGCNHNASHWFLWHFIPNQWYLTPGYFEYCDGCIAALDSHPAILAGDTIGFCPWSSHPVREVMNPLGINNLNYENEISLYPNPTSDKINLKWNSLNNISVIIYNSIGQEFSNVLLSKQNEVIDITNLQAGLYFLKIIDRNKFGIKKIIVDRN